MKATILTILTASMMAGIVFGANLGDKAPAPRENKSDFQREAPTTVREQLSAIFQELELGARSAYWQGNYKLAARYYHLLLKSGKGCCNDLYNLACCYSRMGDAKMAVKYLGFSVEDGFNDAEHIRRDPDFKPLKDNRMFQEAVDRMELEISLRSDDGGNPAPGDEKMARAPERGRVEHREPTGASATVNYGPES